MFEIRKSGRVAENNLSVERLCCNWKKRMFDIFFSSAGILVFAVPFLLIGAVIKITSRGPVFHRSKRIGADNRVFMMLKFRTMKLGTPILEADKIIKPEKYFIFFGKVLRYFGIDELPQLYNILKGDMTFVGPRPVLYNHYGLIEERKKRKICAVKPGLTGLALINGRNNLNDVEKAHYDEIYSHNASLYLDIKILFCTIVFLVSARNCRDRFKFGLDKENGYGDRLAMKGAEKIYR